MAEVTKQPEKPVRLHRFYDWFRTSYRKTQDWRVDGMESYDFVENHQWDQKTLKDLDKEERPALTYNLILGQLLSLSGLQRSNRLDIRALPRGSSDTQAADLMSNLIEFTMNRSNADYEQSGAFDDGLICGLGALEVVRSYDDDLEGELIVRQIDPMQLFVDPESRRPDWDDARFIIKAPFKDPEELVLAFGNSGEGMAEKIRNMCYRMKNDDWLDGFGVDKTLTGNIRQELGEAFYDSHTKKVRVMEVWYRVPKTIPVVVAPDGEVIPIEAGVRGEDVDRAADRTAEAVNGTRDTRRIKVVKCTTVLGWEELQDRQSIFPTRRFPIVPYMPLLYRRMPYGLVRYLKDPQREINKRNSQVLHHINSSANSGWLNDVNQGADPRVLEQVGSKPGVVVNHQGVPPVQIQPNPMPTNLVQLGQMAEQIMGKIGVQPELQGQGSQRFISGRAVQARQFGGQVQVTRFFDQLRMTRKLLGEILVSVLPRLYSERKIREIVDQEMARSPEGAMAGLIASAQGSNEEAALTGQDPVNDLIARARKNRYDIVVEDAPASPTQRQAAFQEMVQIASLFPGLIDPDMIIEHASVKNKDELLARIQQKMEAGFVPQQGGRTAGAIEQTDIGDAGAKASTLMQGQAGTEGT